MDRRLPSRRRRGAPGVLPRLLRAREWGGQAAGLRHERALGGLRTRSLALRSGRPADIFPAVGVDGGLSALALDQHSTDRYLLVGHGDGGVRLHDLERPAPESQVASTGRRRNRGTEGAHAYAVQSLEWFHTDNGIFVSAAPDKAVLVWDTGAFKPVCRFKLPAAVHAARLSPLSGGATGKLIACASSHPFVRLCDLGSGASSVVLQGHNAAVRACAWSPSSEYVLATASLDRSVRLWDLRRSGASSCFAALDQHNAARLTTHRGQKRKSMIDVQNTAHDGGVLGLQFVLGGRFLLSSGSDGRTRLWSSRPQTRDSADDHFVSESTYDNSFVNYSAAEVGLSLAKTGVFAVADSCSPAHSLTVFHAMGLNGSSIGAFDLVRGDYLEECHTMTHTGHFLPITALAFRESAQELYSVSFDGMLLRWASTLLSDEPAPEDASDREQPTELAVSESPEFLDDWDSDIAAQEEAAAQAEDAW
mmetsp:Transcript_1314/g.3248  ORF Transcript_1314/g.3248 Transcript_1314/m.3248 type:complete len:477 (-) Transcript_1314:131-1561(-)